MKKKAVKKTCKKDDTSDDSSVATSVGTSVATSARTSVRTSVATSVDTSKNNSSSSEASGATSASFDSYCKAVIPFIKTADGMLSKNGKKTSNVALTTKVKDKLIQSITTWMDNKLSLDDIKFKTLKYRLTIPMVMEKDEELHARFSTQNFSFKNSLRPLSSSDSNVSGILFTFSVDEYFGKHIPRLPQSAAIKVTSYFVDSETGLGEFTQSDNVAEDSKDPTNIEATALDFFRTNFILKNICPNIVLLYQYFIVDDFRRIGYYMPEFGKMNEMYNRRREIRQQCMVIISEYCEGGSMRKWRKDKHELVEWKTILFQIFYTLAILQNRLNFRHGDLHQANVLIDHTMKDMSRFFQYNIQGMTFNVPASGIFTKLWDFDWCFAPKILQNAKVAKNAFQQNHGNRQLMLKADTHRFLNNVFTSQRGHTHSEVSKFISTVYPSEFLGKETTQIHQYRLKKKSDLR